jgi:hypothetical protein
MGGDLVVRIGDRSQGAVDLPLPFSKSKARLEQEKLRTLEVDMATVEERLAKVERELEIIKRDRQAESSRLGWLERVKGTFKGDSDFEEIVKLGKELRDQESCGGNL